MASRDVRVRVRPDVVRVRVRKTAIRTVVRVAAPHPQLTSQYAYLMESEDLLTFYWLNPTAFGGGGFFSLTCSAEPSVLPFEERLVNFLC